MKRPSNKNKGLYLFLVVIVFFIASCNEKKAENKHAGHDHGAQQDKVYTCPMHPEIIRNEPGACPICGMDLVEKGVSNTEALKPGTMVEPENETVLLQAKITSPVKKALGSEVESKGYITYNPKNTSAISARYAGRIDKLYVRYNFQEVTKGQKIMDIYSPELVTAQQNYIFMLNNKEDESMLHAARQKLLLLGMNETQLQQLKKTRKAEYVVSVYAPASGHIHQMGSPEQLTMPVMPDKNDAQMSNANTEFSIREGTYIKKGKPVFNIISLSQVWAILKIYPEDVKLIKVGQPVEITSEIAPENPIHAKISFIEPLLENDSKFASVRVYLDKSDHHVFKIGSLVTGRISTGKTDGLWISSSAMLDLGNATYVVFKKEDKHFKTQKITIGSRVKNEIQIQEGLLTTDTIATDAWYMIDSESFVLTQ